MEKALFYVKVVGIIFDTTNRKILIGRNSPEENYSFVEGDLNHDEELDACLKRTILEKTGYKVHNLGAIYSENMLQDKSKIKLHFLCERKSDQPDQEGSVKDIIWAKPSEVEGHLGVKLPPRLHEYVTNLE